MKRQSLSENFIFQFLYQGLILVIPIILSPYLTRTLGATALGTVTYVSSIAYYFIILANLGIGVHGKRVISILSDDKIEQRKCFWSLFSLHAILSICAIILYLLFVVLFVKDNKIIFLIDVLYVASALFDITWLFYGMENFSSVVIKNAIVRILGCLLIFIFVKTPSDICEYTLIEAGVLLFGQIAMLPQALKILRPIRFDLADIKVHIKPILIFSVAIIATSLYTVFDKTLLGLIDSMESVAYYEYANKIVNVPKTFVETASLVMFPRACKLIFQNKTEEHEKYVDYNFLITSIIGFGSMWGIISIAHPFTILFYGDSFEMCGNIMIALSPLICIISLGRVFRSLFLIPYKMDKEFNLCIIYNALINLALNLVLIPHLGVQGAVIGTIVAESFGLIYQMILCRKIMNLRIMINATSPFCIIGFLMFLVIKATNCVIDVYSWAGLIETIVIGASVYSVLVALYLLKFRKDLVLMLKKSIQIKLSRTNKQ